jgi:hypothetical protein
MTRLGEVVLDGPGDLLVRATKSWSMAKAAAASADRDDPQPGCAVHRYVAACPFSDHPPDPLGDRRGSHLLRRVRARLKMLPILLFESAWKLTWLTAVALPLWTPDQMDAATLKVASACLWVVIVLAVIPWRDVVAQYVTKPGGPWRSDATRQASDQH